MTTYSCDQKPCALGFHVPFEDGTDQSKKFKQRANLNPDRSMGAVTFCACSKGKIYCEIENEEEAMPEHYGALMLVCDLSGSMSSPAEGGQSHVPTTQKGQKNRLRVVSELVTGLLQDFALSGGGHFSNLLLSVVRFGATTSVYQLPATADNSRSPRWFTTKELANAMQWGPSKSGDGYSIEDIQKTVDNHLLDTHSVSRDDTRLGLALQNVIELGKVLDESKSLDLPSNYGGIEPFQAFPSLRKFWGAIYSDGRITDAELVRKLIASDDMKKLRMTRITSFIGKTEDASDATGGRLLRELASTCFAPHAEPTMAFYNQEQSKHLRDVLRMATMVDPSRSGVCPLCTLRH